MLRKIFLFFVILGILGVVAAGGVAFWAYNKVTRDLPKLDSIEDYKPPAVTTVYSSEGTPIAEFYLERRYPVKLKDVPLFVRNSVLAAEDANFYSHPGIDFLSILRAIYKNITTGKAKQGASTITQQVVKNLLLSREKTFERKIKEAILAYRLEKQFSKDEILELYLNEIFFGNNAYGIKAAAKAYFNKELSELTLAEAAILAGLPQAPSRYTPNRNQKESKARQHYVLGQMVKSGFITQESAASAEKENVVALPASVEKIFRAPYFATEVRRLLVERLGSEEEVDVGGYTVYTTLDLTAYDMATKALRKGLREVDKRRGWRGPIGDVSASKRDSFLEEVQKEVGEEVKPDVVYPAVVLSVSRQEGIAKISVGKTKGTVNLKESSWAKKKLDKQDRSYIIKVEDEVNEGDVIEVVLKSSPEEKDRNDAPIKPRLEFSLDQTPEIEGAITVLDPHSGKVIALVGGYSFQRSVFNRATQSYRQPGSTFKPIVYLSAVDGFNYTPATIVYDEPRTFRVGDQFWTPGNFDKKYMGAITLRTALEKSRNLVSADIVSRIGLDAIISYARKMGITSPLGKNLSLSLGSSEVTLLELSRAYGVFAARGVLFDSILITKIVDRRGNVIFDYDNEKFNKAKQVIDENSAFIMANMMKGVIEHGTGYRVKELGRPVAGKTGTSNDQMDSWFIGYTPDWVAGVWTGFDLKKSIGDKETGGRVAAPIFLYFMQDFLAYQDKKKYDEQVKEAKTEADHLGIEFVPPQPLPPLDFSIPEGVDPYWVDRETGVLSDSSNKGAIYEYFKRGTEPLKQMQQEQTENYLQSPEL